jgi:hypothetical protein
MNYQYHYDMLINRAKLRTLVENKETHHIIPRCHGGTNDANNLVNLTTEEHYVAHQLLVNIYPGNHSLVYAAHMMGATRINNKMYGWLKREYVKSCTGRPKSEEARKNMSLAKQDYIPWNAGVKTGIITKGCFTEGNTPWNKGKEHMAGKDNPAYGKTWNIEKRNKMSETNKGRKRVYADNGTFHYVYPHLENKEIT